MAHLMGWPDTGWQPTAEHERRPWWLRRWRLAASGDLPVAESVGRRLEVGGDSVNQFGGFGEEGAHRKAALHGGVPRQKEAGGARPWKPSRSLAHESAQGGGDGPA
jgi:hypothetical protein